MDDQDRYWPQRTDSSGGSNDIDREIAITRCAQIILGSYRRDDFADPDNFLASLVVVLKEYSNEVIAAVTDPRTGIQRTCKFPPSIADFVEFCNETQRRMNWASNYDARSRQQLARREKFKQQSMDETPEQRAAAVERNFAELRKRGGEFQKLANVAAKAVGQQEEPPPYDDRETSAA